MYLGFDGYRGGWVVAGIDDKGNHYFDYAPSLNRLLSVSFTRAMIDIPIGLPDQGYRACDREARLLVGNAVFLGARRNLLAFASYGEANAFYWQNEGLGHGISKQLWGIRDKIKEVDEYIAANPSVRLFETHPEVVFHYIRGNPLAPKITEDGRRQRLEILHKHGFTKATRWLGWRHGTGIGRDDLIDACACAIAARDSKSWLGTAEEDELGRPMRIAY